MAQEQGVLPPRIVWFLCLVAVLPLFAIQFGLGNQLEQFPIIERLRDPGFAAGDAYLDSAAGFGQPRYYYSLLVATLTAVAPLHIVIHALTVLSSFGLGLATYLAGRRLIGADTTGAALAAVLAMLNHGFSMGYAGFLTFESFQPANISVAAAIAATVLLMLGRTWPATAAYLFACLMHPTLGAEIALIGYAAVFAGALLSRDRHRLTSAALGGAVFVLGFAAAWVLPGLGSTGAGLSDAEFFAILVEFRAPHHYLGLEFAKRRWLEALLFLAATSAILGMAWRAGAPRQNLTVLGLIVAAVVGICALSLYFVDVAESRLWATAQVFRMALLLKWVGFLLIGWIASRWLRSKDPALVILAGLMILPALDALSYALVAALATWFLLSQLKLRGWLAVALTIPAVLVAVYHMNRYGAGDQTLRLAVACAALWLVSLRMRLVGTVAATALVATFLIGGYQMRHQGLFGMQIFAGGLTLADRTDDGTEISRLARNIGPADAIWLVPPSLEQFRYVAGKAVVADFTSIPFSDAGLRDWRQRMANVYGDTPNAGFAALSDMMARHRDAPMVDAAHRIHGADYAVLFTDTPWEGEVLAEAGEFKIVRIAP